MNRRPVLGRLGPGEHVAKPTPPQRRARCAAQQSERRVRRLLLKASLGIVVCLGLVAPQPSGSPIPAPSTWRPSWTSSGRPRASRWRSARPVGRSPPAVESARRHHQRMVSASAVRRWPSAGRWCAGRRGGDTEAAAVGHETGRVISKRVMGSPPTVRVDGTRAGRGPAGGDTSGPIVDGGPAPTARDWAPPAGARIPRNSQMDQMWTKGTARGRVGERSHV